METNCEICKFCPNCQTPTIKTHGCNRIKCPVCKVQWCFVCVKASGTNSKQIRKKLSQCSNEEAHTSKDYLDSKPQ